MAVAACLGQSEQVYAGLEFWLMQYVIYLECMVAGVGLWLVVMGGRSADVSWFLTRTDAFLNDVVIMDR